MPTPKSFPAKTQIRINEYVAKLNYLHRDAFNRGYSVTGGRKFAKIVRHTSCQQMVHSFIDADGNLWKPATWRAPAKNFSRGNIFSEDFANVEKCRYSVL